MWHIQTLEHSDDYHLAWRGRKVITISTLFIFQFIYTKLFKKNGLSYSHFGVDSVRLKERLNDGELTMKTE